MKRIFLYLSIAMTLAGCQKKEFDLELSPWDPAAANVIVTIDSITENPNPGGARIHYTIDESYLPEPVTWGYTYGFRDGSALPFYTVTSFRYLVDPNAVSGETYTYEMFLRIFPETDTRRFGPFEVQIP